MAFIFYCALSHRAGGSGWRLTSLTGRWRPWWSVYSHGAPCGGEARRVGARGLCSFFCRERKNQRTRASPAGLRSIAARLGLLLMIAQYSTDFEYWGRVLLVAVDEPAVWRLEFASCESRRARTSCPLSGMGRSTIICDLWEQQMLPVRMRGIRAARESNFP